MSSSDSSEFSIIQLDSASQNKHWRMLRNLFRAACLFRHHDAKTIEDVNDLVRSVQQIPTDRPYRIRKEHEKFSSSLAQAVREYRRVQSIFQIIEQGNPKDLPELERIIDEDPRKYLRDKSAPNSLMNSKNHAGVTPLIVSAKNGSLEFVRFLLAHGVDWKIRSTFDKENALEAAARWEHSKVVKELMKMEWSKKEINLAYKVAASQDVRKLIKKSGGKKSCCF
jgi:Txe/YoeB family toxin of Txe-Axe toxin-antitoxin module